jgi:hypothetical protein
MENNKIALYVKIDVDLKNRASLHVTQCKVMNKEPVTINQLVEDALQEYLINHPL